MQTVLPQTTCLLAASQVVMVEGKIQRPLYGYMKHPLIEDENSAIDIQKDQECRQDRPARKNGIKAKNLPPEIQPGNGEWQEGRA